MPLPDHKRCRRGDILPIFPHETMTENPLFFDLPLEVRDEIYAHALGSEAIEFTHNTIRIEAILPDQAHRYADYSTSFLNLGLPTWLLTNRRFLSEGLKTIERTRVFQLARGFWPLWAHPILGIKPHRSHGNELVIRHMKHVRVEPTITRTLKGINGKTHLQMLDRNVNDIFVKALSDNLTTDLCVEMVWDMDDLGMWDNEVVYSRLLCWPALCTQVVISVRGFVEYGGSSIEDELDRVGEVSDLAALCGQALVGGKNGWMDVEVDGVDIVLQTIDSDKGRMHLEQVVECRKLT